MDAIEILGSSQPDDDWILKPDQHADLLPDEAAPLVAILRNSKINTIITKYKDADEKAIHAQKKYKLFSKFGAYSGECER